MRYGPVLLVLLLAACGNDDAMTRKFGMNRDSGPEVSAGMDVPLSVPPDLSARPTRSGAAALNQDTGQSLSQGPVSPGQDALLQAAGPAASANARTKVDDNSGLVYPSQAFVDQVMNWTLPPGHQSLVTKADKGWFSWF